MQERVVHETVEIDYEALPEDASLLAHLSAGAFAGIMEHTAMFPVDSIKTRMQIATDAKLLGNGIISNISRIVSKEGVFSLWRGVSSVVLGAGPAHAVYFSSFESTKTFLVNELTNSKSHKIVTDENHPLIASGAGIAATTVSDALMTPFDVLKQRIQALPEVKLEQQIKSIRLMKIASGIYQKEGLSAFYVSYPTTLFTNIPLAALNFGFYEYTSSKINPDRDYSPYLHCIAGGVAGGIAAAMTTPLDCIKTALQTRGISQNEKLRRINSFLSASKALYLQYGLLAFTKGMRPRIIFNIPSTAISWTAYEMAKEVLLRS